MYIVYAYWEDLHSTARTAADMLGSCSALSRLDFSPNNRVTDAYGDYLDEWSDHRERLQQDLDAVAEGCRKSLESFKAAEDELISLLGHEAGR